jgi:hypothetical protein
MSKTAYNDFKHSACFDCGYCGERKMPESEAGMLDVRKNGIVKVWCYAANDVIAIMPEMEKEECLYYIEAEAE